MSKNAQTHRLNWDDLQFFISVSRSGTLSSAARELRTNHATVSRRIDRLEEALGRKLFERNPRGYVLTSVGERLVESAHLMAQQADLLRNESANDAVKVGGVVRLSTLEGFGSFFLADELPEFCRMQPSIGVELITIQQIVSLSRREADVSITLSPLQAENYHRELITPYRLLVYGSKKYLASQPPIRRREDLKDHRFVGYISDMIFTPGLDYLNDVTPGIRSAYQCSSIYAQLRAGIAGAGLVILPTFVAQSYPDLVPVLEREVQLTREYWCLTHRELADLPRVRMLIDFIKAATQRDQHRFMPPARA